MFKLSILSIVELSYKFLLSHSLSFCYFSFSMFLKDSALYGFDHCAGQVIVVDAIFEVNINCLKFKINHLKIIINITHFRIISEI